MILYTTLAIISAVALGWAAKNRVELRKIKRELRRKTILADKLNEEVLNAQSLLASQIDKAKTHESRAADTLLRLWNAEKDLAESLQRVFVLDARLSEIKEYNRVRKAKQRAKAKALKAQALELAQLADDEQKPKRKRK
ncbi:hypothetical protein [Runella sp.]|uniref:hypothetical protein n=1 Tax=Runella sp. TaxID=1960881 RepID=UPI003019B90C